MQKRFVLASIFVVLVILISASKASAVGGTCPSGANYLSLTSPQTGGGAGSVTLSSLGITSCYFISAAGSDSNNGTTEATPWLHAPGMPACTATCSSTTPVAGNGFIFRGGDSWHKASGSPLTGGAWTWGVSGTSPNPIYIGIDVTWFSGGGFARPIFNEDNTITTTSPSSCAHNDDGTTFVDFSGRSNVIFDGFEFTGDCTNAGSDGVVIDQGTFTIAERLYIHGWSVGTSAIDDTHVLLGNGNGNIANDTNRILFVVIDGVDSTFGNVCNTPSCVPDWTDLTGAASGWAISNCWDVEYTIIRHSSQGLQCGDASIFHDNLMEYIFESLIASRHGNVFEVTIDGAGTLCSNFIGYNNVTRHTNQGVGWWLQCPNYYIFNNIFEDSGHFPPDGNELLMSPPGSSGTSIVHASIFNNTFDGTVAGGAGPSNSATPGWASGSTATLSNNHLLDVTTIGQFFGCTGSGNTCTLTNGGGNVFQTTAAANGQGYTLANNWAPTSGGDATVGTGANETSFCNGIPNSTAVAACKAAIGGVVETTAWGGKFSSYPYTTVVARPGSGAWDGGAYEFNTPTPGPSASFSPSSVSFPNTVVAASSSPVTVTLTNTGTAIMTISSITLTGTNTGDFFQSNSCGGTLAATASCSFSVTFTPATTGARSAFLTVADDAPGSPQGVSISGTGISSGGGGGGSGIAVPAPGIIFVP